MNNTMKLQKKIAEIFFYFDAVVYTVGSIFMLTKQHPQLVLDIPGEDVFSVSTLQGGLLHVYVPATGVFVISYVLALLQLNPWKVSTNLIMMLNHVVMPLLGFPLRYHTDASFHKLFPMLLSSHSVMLCLILFRIYVIMKVLPALQDDTDKKMKNGLESTKQH